MLQVKDDSYVRSLTRDLLCFAPTIGSELTQLGIAKKLICGARIFGEWEQAPVRSNRVTLANEVDRFGIPRAHLAWKLGRLDQRTVQSGLWALGEYLVNQDLGRLRVFDWVMDDSAFHTQPPDHYVGHHMGGTRMAASEEEGVVDKNCQVFGSENLYIAGSSVFVRGAHVNPTLTIVQLSLRLADHLAKPPSSHLPPTVHAH
jgi:choline dehydrogenase-like flavoprotein